MDSGKSSRRAVIDGTRDEVSSSIFSLRFFTFYKGSSAAAPWGPRPPSAPRAFHATRISSIWR